MEIGELVHLEFFGMERGGLTGTIPSEIGRMTNLVFVDLDFNSLSGALPAELFSLSGMTQLDLNNNQFSGSISGIGNFPQLEFLQIHENGFTGTVPSSVGTFSKLEAFNLHATNVSGVMPLAVCDLLVSNGGVLESLTADCAGTIPEINCTCCTACV